MVARINLLKDCHVTFFWSEKCNEKPKGPSTSPVMDVLVTVPRVHHRLILQILAVS